MRQDAETNFNTLREALEACESQIRVDLKSMAMTAAVEAKGSASHWEEFMPPAWKQAREALGGSTPMQASPQPDYNALYRAIVSVLTRPGPAQHIAGEVIMELASAQTDNPWLCLGCGQRIPDEEMRAHQEQGCEANNKANLSARLSRSASECHASQPEPEAAHDYTSTACQHGFHERCRKNCKFCQVPCRCPHHKQPASEKPASARTYEDGCRDAAEVAEGHNCLNAAASIRELANMTPPAPEEPYDTQFPCPSKPAAPRLPLESEVVEEMDRAYFAKAIGAPYSRRPESIDGMTAALGVADKWLLNRASPAPEGGERVTVSEDETYWIVRVQQGQRTSFPKNRYSRSDRDAFAETLRDELAAKEKW